MNTCIPRTTTETQAEELHSMTKDKPKDQGFDLVYEVARLIRGRSNFLWSHCCCVRSLVLLELVGIE